MRRFFLATLLPAAALSGLVLAAFAPVLAEPGIVGHTWDWGVPNFAEQFRAMADHHFSTWDAYFGTGRYHYFKLELLYWLLLAPFSAFGGAVVSKVLPMVLVLCSGLAMSALAKRNGLNPLFATMAAAFYALSPYTFSRIAAGHMPMLAGYALLPCIVLAAQTALDRIDRRRRGATYATVLAGFLLGLSSLHPGAGMSGAAMTALLFLHRFLTGKRRAALVCSLGLICATAVAMNIHFMAPFFGDYFGKGAIRHGWGLSKSSRGEVTVDTELPRREAYHQSTSQPADASAFLRLRPGMDTEYAYPVPAALGPLWILSSLVLTLLVFAQAFFRNKTKAVSGLFLLAVAGVLLVSGSRTLPGFLFYQGALKKTLPILFAAFSNTTRWLPLIVLPYAVLAFGAAQRLLADARGRTKLLWGGGLLLVLLVFLSPYLSGGLVRDYDKKTTPQPLTLKITPIHPEDGEVYAWLRDQRLECRAAYLPPIGITWPGDTNRTFEWSSAYSPKPFALAFMTHPLGREAVRALYAEYPNRNASRLMGLLSIGFLPYPEYEHAYTYEDFQPGYRPEGDLPMVDGYKDYKPVLDAGLALQSGLEPLKLFRETAMLRNRDFLPLLRPGDCIAAVEGVGARSGGDVVASALPHLAGLPDYDPATVYVRAGRDPAFLSFLSRIMGGGKNDTRVLFDRETGAETLILTPRAKTPAPVIEFRRIGPAKLRARAHGVRASFPLVFQETFHPGWRLALVPRTAEGFRDDAETLEELLQGYRIFKDNALEQAPAEQLSRLVSKGLVSTLGDGTKRSDAILKYGEGGRAATDREEHYSVDFVSTLRAGAVQNENLPAGPRFETDDAGRFVPKHVANVADAGTTRPESPDPLNPDSWDVSGADGRRAVVWPRLFHLRAYGYANAWLLDPALLSLLPKAGPHAPGYFLENPDGTMDFELVLEFAPQQYYAMGLRLSAGVMAACAAYLIFGGLWGLWTARRRAHG